MIHIHFDACIVHEEERKMDLKELTKELSRLNPGAGIVSGLEGNPKVIFGLLEPEKLVMPKGYSYNEKDGITNKHESETGRYNYFEYRLLFEKKKKSWLARIFGK